MKIDTIKTHKIVSEESILDILDKYLPKLGERDIVAISSKIISICENRISNQEKSTLIKEEAEKCFPHPDDYPNFFLTLKNHRLIPNAGIDESNSGDRYTLLPKDPQLTAKKFWEHLRQKHQIENLGIIITDSNVSPIREGVTGITIGWCGFEPIYSYVDKKDIFDKPLHVTEINLLDSLATAATLNMGEGNEQTPIAVISDPPLKISFKNRAPTKSDEEKTYIDHNSDLFGTVISYE